MTSDPTYRDLLYFIKLLYTIVFAVTVSLVPFYWGCFIFLISYIWIDTICPKCLQLGIDYTGCVTSLVIMGKSVCPSCQKQHARRVHLYIRNILGHHFTVRIHCRQYIQWVLYCWLLSSRAVPRRSTRILGRHKSGRAPENFCAMCRCTLRENKTSKQDTHICTFICVFVSAFCTPV